MNVSTVSSVLSIVGKATDYLLGLKSCLGFTLEHCLLKLLCNKITRPDYCVFTLAQERGPILADDRGPHRNLGSIFLYLTKSFFKFRHYHVGRNATYPRVDWAKVRMCPHYNLLAGTSEHCSCRHC